MGIKQAWVHFSVRNARPINVSITVVLLLLSLACYPLFLILFLHPRWYNRDSLVHPDVDSNITPAVAIGLISVLFASTTLSLITRCVEHSLWHQLQPQSSNTKSLTAGEIRGLANWAISVTSRLSYLLMGSSWPLKLAGVLLLFLSVLNPVIVSGISQTRSSTTTTYFAAAQKIPFDGFVDAANLRYNGGNFRDVRGTAAAIISLNNLTAPSSSVCNGFNGRECHASARAAALRADCTASTLPNTQGVALFSSKLVTESFCSTLSPGICVSLESGDPVAFANFSAGYINTCSTDQQTSCPGDFATVFGAFVMNPGSTTFSHDINLVDCAISYGNVSITQNGTSSPTLDRETYARSERLITEAFTELRQFQRIYTESGRQSSPYSFGARAAGTGANTLFESALGTLLLGANLDAPADVVARRIEAAFDTQTLFAFSRFPDASDITLTYVEAGRFVYVYDARVLIILLAPFLATILGCWGRWWVGGMDVIGYDVVRIARMGPVTGLESKETELEDIDDVKITCVDEGLGKRLVTNGSVASGYSYHNVG